MTCSPDDHVCEACGAPLQWFVARRQSETPAHGHERRCANERCARWDQPAGDDD